MGAMDGRASRHHFLRVQSLIPTSTFTSSAVFLPSTLRSLFPPSSPLLCSLLSYDAQLDEYGSDTSPHYSSMITLPSFVFHSCALHSPTLYPFPLQLPP